MRNTLMLYMRMLLLMFIGLFTSRVVLAALGETDYGVYNAVGGVVTLFTFVSSSVSAAISRYIAFELGRGGDSVRLHKVFSAGLAVQFVFVLLLVLFVETAGVWFLHSRMNIPADRLGAASVVLQCSLLSLVLQLLAVPYNAAIIAHEKMGAFAAISLIEAALKLAVALSLKHGGGDKLVLYAVLLTLAALLVRLCYGLYCRKHIPDTRGRFMFDKGLVAEMLSFSGWNFFGSSAYVLNTQGITILVNLFFGVALNAARGVAAQIEGTVKQFVSSVLTAINPRITKSWANGDKDYCFSLVFKGAKFTFLVILAFLLPLAFESEAVLDIWLARVPAHSAVFVRLALVALMADLFGNTVLTLVLATGRVRNYYLVTGLSSYLCLPLVWLLFRSGAPVEWSYWGFIIVYAAVLVMKLAFARRLTGFPVARFLRETVLPLIAMSLLSAILPLLIYILVPQGFVRLLAVCLTSWASIAVFACLMVLTPGERAFLTRKLGRHRVPLRWALEDTYYENFGRRPDLKRPKRYTEKVQRMLLDDHNPLYHKMVDKYAVKAVVAEKIGEEHIIPTLGVWDRAEDIDWEALPERFVLKCTHDSGSVLVCRDKSAFDRDAACGKLARCLKRDYWKETREWGYKGVKPRVIAEKYLGDDIADYKFFCFGGRPEILYVATDRGRSDAETRFDFFDMEFRHLDVRNGHPNADAPLPRPQTFGRMKALAARLSEGFAQVRVDFYEIDGRVYFGEYTLYHLRGMVPFEPDEWDYKLGALWEK